jgi:osmotically-inducible protein OsmY
MRTIRRLLFLTVVGVVGVAAYNHWSDNGWPLRSKAAVLDAQQHAKEKAARFATRATAQANSVAEKLGDKMSESALTAKIKSKMALDDHVNARAIDVDASGSVVTLTGTVRSKDQHERAVRLARDTEGVTRVVDRLRVQN